MKKVYIVLLGLLALYGAGLGVRRTVLQAQFKTWGRQLPFTLEGAVNFRRIRQVVEDGRLPDIDTHVQYPEGIDVRRTDTVGAEGVYAALTRLLPSSMSLSQKMRWLQPAWFCLGIPLMFCWIWLWRRSVSGAFTAAAFYAFALSSVIRSTGQEISHENFALPLLIAHLALQFASRTEDWKGRGASVASAALLALALITWDLIQFYVFMWMAVSTIRFFRKRFVCDGQTTFDWLVHFGALVAVGVFNPYFRAHAFLASPIMMLGYGLIAGWFAKEMAASGRLNRRWGEVWPVAAIVFLPMILMLAAPLPYSESYGHFGELMVAKIRFLNRKPLDPSLLTFNQRIMWVPALNSATWPLVRTLFPAMLPLTILAVPVVLWRSNERRDSRLFQLLFFYAASLTAFVLFVRFQVFLAVFSAGLLGLLGAWAAEKRCWTRMAVAAALGVGLILETVHVLRKPERWGRTVVYYDELEELVDWLGRYAAPEPVLSNFGNSGMIVTYADCPVILHPKFETRAIRERVREYGEALFKGTEESFRDWAASYGAEYYVYSVGEFSSVELQYQMRYCVDAVECPESSPARLFEGDPENRRNFKYLWGNRKYRVFKILTGNENSVAARFSQMARQALEVGDLTRAEDKGVAALLLEPTNADAQETLRLVGALKDQGFRYEADELN